MFQKTSVIIITNFHQYWKNPLMNKYLTNSMHNYEGMLVLKKRKKNIFFCHPFNYNQAKKEFEKKVIVKKFDKKELKNSLKNFETIGYDANHTSINQLKNLKKIFEKKVFIDCSKQIKKSREIKTFEEIKNISNATKKTRKILSKIKQELKKNVTEKEIAIIVKKEFEKNGLETMFCIIAFGKNTTNLHHNPTNKKLENGPVLFDIGGKYNGYCSDLSESCWFGEKSEDFVEYEKELKRINNYFEKIKKIIQVGMQAKKLFELLGDEKLPHAIGHGLGLEEHDFPQVITPKSNWLLKEGMVLAIEPGFYNTKFGIRIEKNFLVKKDGFKEL